MNTTLLYIIETKAGEAGPFTEDQLVHQWRAGTITADQRFRMADDSQWLPVLDLIAILEEPTKPTPRATRAFYPMPKPHSVGAGNYHGVVTVRKSRGVFIILGLFLGGLGIHNFYAGYHGKGFVQLLLTLSGFLIFIPFIVVFIWVIVDLVTVTKDSSGLAFA